jgi:hypothetical protein
MWLVGKSVVVGLDPGESEVKEAALERAEAEKGVWEEMAIVVG